MRANLSLNIPHAVNSPQDTLAPPSSSNQNSLPSISLSRQSESLGLAEFTPTPLSEAKKHAGTVILRNWRKFVASRNDVIARHLACSMGEQVKNSSSFKDLINDGRIVVHVNGASGDSTRGHSAIYYRSIEHHLLVSTHVSVDNPKASRYGMSKQAAEYFNEKFQRPIYRSGDHSMIFRGFILEKDLGAIVEKGNLFALYKRFSGNFDEALHMATQKLHDGPYSWGLNYNCNVFILDFLKKIRDLSK